MSATVTPITSRAAATPEPKSEDRQAAIDRFGQKSDEEAELKARLSVASADRKKLEAEMASWYEGHAADQGDVAEGCKYLVQVSPREYEREIFDKTQIFEIWLADHKLLKGLKKLKLFNGFWEKLSAFFTEACGITLTWVDKHIPESQHEVFLTKEQTGSRHFKAVRKTAPADPKAA